MDPRFGPEAEQTSPIDLETSVPDFLLDPSRRNSVKVDGERLATKIKTCFCLMVGVNNIFTALSADAPTDASVGV